MYLVPSWPKGTLTAFSENVCACLIGKENGVDKDMTSHWYLCCVFVSKEVGVETQCH